MYTYIWKMYTYIQNMLRRKQNTFIIESSSLFSLHMCKHPTQRMPFPCWKDILLGVHGFKFPQTELFYTRWVLCWKKNTVMPSPLYAIFSCLTYNQLIPIWSGSVGQANGKHVAHKSLHNLGVSWVFSYSAVPGGTTVCVNTGTQGTLLSET